MCNNRLSNVEQPFLVMLDAEQHVKPGWFTLSVSLVHTHTLLQCTMAWGGWNAPSPMSLCRHDTHRTPGNITQ